MSLTLSTKASPFPYAALAIATYTQKAELNFDDTATGISLDLDGDKYATEEEIVAILARIASIDGENTKVDRYLPDPSWS